LNSPKLYAVMGNVRAFQICVRIELALLGAEILMFKIFALKS
jgi:hypothetical protein